MIDVMLMTLLTLPSWDSFRSALMISIEIHIEGSVGKYSKTFAQQWDTKQTI